MRTIDLSSWEGLFTTLLGLALFSLVVVGIRLLVMQTVQMRRERENRQINERLRTLIVAYKTLGGSFTGNLAVDPTHLRDLRATSARDGSRAMQSPDTGAPSSADTAADDGRADNSERRRRVRDAVEAALSDVILLGTDEQVRLAVRAANDMVAGRLVETAELVVSLRMFIREVLDLDPVPPELAIPRQGPARPGSSSGRSARDERGGGAARSSAGRGAGGQGGGAGVAGFGVDVSHEADDGGPGHHGP